MENDKNIRPSYSSYEDFKKAIVEFFNKLESETHKGEEDLINDAIDKYKRGIKL